MRTKALPDDEWRRRASVHRVCLGHHRSTKSVVHSTNPASGLSQPATGPTPASTPQSPRSRSSCRSRCPATAGGRLCESRRVAGCPEKPSTDPIALAAPWDHRPNWRCLTHPTNSGADRPASRKSRTNCRRSTRPVAEPARRLRPTVSGTARSSNR